MVLFGRDKELARIRAVIRNSPESALVVSGNQGTGKTALLAEIPAMHAFRTVAFRAHPPESSWPLSGLTALLNQVGSASLAAATVQLTGRPGAETDLPALSSLLLAALRRQPCTRTAVAVDDAEELDPASQAVLGFLARRLAGTGIVLILSLRHQTPGSPFGRLASLRVPDLGHGDTVKMLRSVTAGHLDDAAIHAVAAVAHGNPLAAMELLNALPQGPLQDKRPGQFALPVPLYSPGSFEAEHAAIISGLSPSAHRVLEILSLSYRSSLRVLEGMAGDLTAGMEEILSAGLAVRSGSQLVILDQMLRGRVFSAMPPERRSACHQALAAAAETADPVACPWYLSYAPQGRRETSLRLLGLAVELVRAGELQSALEYVERALAIAPGEAETAVRLGTIAQLLFSRGEFVQAKRYLGWALRITKSRALILRLTGLDLQIELLAGNSVRPGTLLSLVTASGHHDPAFSAGLLSLGALHLADRWQVEDAGRLLQAAAELPGTASRRVPAMGQLARLLADAVEGAREGKVEEVRERNPDLYSPVRAGGGNNPVVPPLPKGPAHSSVASLILQARIRSYGEDYEGARDLFALVRDQAADSDANWRATAGYFSADNEIRAGAFRSAIALIDDIAGSASSLQYHRGMHDYLLLWRAYAVGDDAEVRVRLAAAQSSAGTAQATAQRIACQGQFALLRGDTAEAAALLARAAEIGTDFPNPALLRCEPDLIEALVRSGRRSEAVRALATLEYRSAGLRSRWLRMAVSRSRALVLDGEASLGLFAKALAAPEKDDSIFERARTLACYAERLAASGRPLDAKDRLLAAKTIFDQTGAAGWARHVDVLLAGARVQADPAGQGVGLPLLSDHESELVQLVARGRRNKEIAASLFVSVRTVEVRLTGIYRKLGVQSRSQLTSLLVTRERPPAFAAVPLSVSPS